jgi:hypothetical protein
VGTQRTRLSAPACTTAPGLARARCAAFQAGPIGPCQADVAFPSLLHVAGQAFWVPGPQVFNQGRPLACTRCKAWLPCRETCVRAALGDLACGPGPGALTATWTGQESPTCLNAAVRAMTLPPLLPLVCHCHIPPWAPTPRKPQKGIQGLVWGGAAPHQPAVAPCGKLVLGPPPRGRGTGTRGSDQRSPTRLHSAGEHLAPPHHPQPPTWHQFVL